MPYKGVRAVARKLVGLVVVLVNNRKEYSHEDANFRSLLHRADS